jgi:hypothetical protein
MEVIQEAHGELHPELPVTNVSSNVTTPSQVAHEPPVTPLAVQVHDTEIDHDRSRDSSYVVTQWVSSLFELTDANRSMRCSDWKCDFYIKPLCLLLSCPCSASGFCTRTLIIHNTGTEPHDDVQMTELPSHQELTIAVRVILSQCDLSKVHYLRSSACVI